jgi:PAS domain S-box-containing protein
MTVPSIERIRKLEGLLNDLRSVLALQSGRHATSGQDALGPIADLLLRTLDLQFVFARTASKATGACCDVVRLERRYSPHLSEGLTAALEPWLSPRGSSRSRLRFPPLGTRALSVATFTFGSPDVHGKLIVGTARAGFPSEIENLLLRVAANQASVACAEQVRPHATGYAVRPRTQPSSTLKDNPLAGPGSLTQLHQFSTDLIETGDLSAVLEEMLAAVMEVQAADFGNVQLLDAERGGLVIVAQRNFQRPFLEHLALVPADRCDSYRRATRTRERIIIEDVQTETGFEPYLPVAAEAGFRALVATPLIGHRGELLGMLSTHFRKPHRPTEYELRLTDIYAQQTARMLERKRMEEERNKLAAIVQNCSDFIGIATLGRRAVFVNAAGRRMVGLQDDEPLPANITAYVAEGQQDRLLNHALPVVEREGFWAGEMHFHHIPTGRPIPVLQHIFYIKESGTGRRLALATISRDMTERKRAELALNNAQQELAHASRILSIGELTASLAHEINQPLAAIVANANACHRWLEREIPDYEHARRSLQNIARDGNRASAILQRVREFAAKAPPSRVPLNLNEVVHEVLGIVSNEIAREQIALRVDLATKLPDIVADRIELQQVVLNLIINSIEALRPVSGRSKELSVTSERRRGAVEVAVRDTGKGIGAQDLGCIFEAFFTTKSDGMGLGLAISRRIIEAHNGKLWAAANPGGGLTLRFILPARGKARSPARTLPP